MSASHMLGMVQKVNVDPHWNCDYSPQLPCYDVDNKVCYDYACLKPLDPAGKCDTPTNVCPCNTYYNDGTKDQPNKACCGSGCPTHRDLIPSEFLV